MTGCDDCGWQECFTEGRCLGGDAAVVVSSPVFIGIDLGLQPSIGIYWRAGPDGRPEIVPAPAADLSTTNVERL